MMFAKKEGHFSWHQYLLDQPFLLILQNLSNPVIVLAVLMTTAEHNLHSLLGHLNRLVYEKLLGALYHKDLLPPKKSKTLIWPYLHHAMGPITRYRS